MLVDQAVYNLALLKDAGGPPPPPPPPPPVTPAVPNIPDCGEYRDARGRIPVDPNIFKQPHSIILGCAGQSMLGNFASLTPFSPWTGVYELCTQTGLIYEVTDGTFPTMGMNGWFNHEVGANRLSVLPYWAQMLVATGKAARVLLAAHNVGGTFAAQWCPIGMLFQRSIGTIQWLQSLGIPPNYWVEMLGQSDVYPTDPVTYNGNVLQPAASGQNFADYMQWKFLGMRGAGYHGPILMGRGAFWDGISNGPYAAKYAMIKQGQQLCAVGPNGAGVSIGPDDDVWLPASVYRVDGVHPNDNMRYYQWNGGALGPGWNTAFPVF